MRAKLLSIITIVALLFSVAPITAMAAGEVTINAIPATTPGSNITVSGTTVLDRVTIKVIRPDQTILDYDSVAPTNGTFTYSFKLPATTATGDYSVVAGKGNIVATQTFKVNSAGIFIPGPGSSVPPQVELPPAAQEALVEVGKKLDELFKNLPGNNGNGNGNQPPKSDNAVKKEVAKLAEEAVKNAGTVDVSGSVQTENGVAKVKLDASALSETFKKFKNLVDAVNSKVQEKDSNAAPIHVIATLDLGKVEGNNIQVPISKELLQAAKAEGINEIAFKINGMVVSLSVDELKADTTMDIVLEDDTVADNATDKKRVSGVYNFEFTTNGQAVSRFSKPVKVSLPVEGLENVDADLLVFAKIVDGALQFYGGKYNKETGNFDAERTQFSTYTVIENKVQFSDLEKVQSWAGRSIEVAAAKGIINGRGNNKFEPQGNVTRAEFATLLVKTFGLENVTLTESFADVKDGAWHQKYIAAAVHSGIVTGRSASKFDPNASITRAEMATMAANALRQVLDYSDVEKMNESLKKFKDAADVKSYFKASVALMAEEGIINGKGAGSFDPNGKSTRAEAAVIIYKMFNLR